MKSRLTFLEASGLVVGAGVGGGVMAVPYLASQTGILAFIPVILIAAAINIVLNLLLVEVLIRDGRNLQIVELISTYVFRRRAGRFLSWVLFAVLGLSFIGSLTAYISGAGDVISALLGISSQVSRLIAYGFSALIVFLGLKSVGYSEKIALGLLLVFSAVIGFGSMGAWDMPAGAVSVVSGSGRKVLALFGLVMYSLNAAFAVPQVVKGLGRDPASSSWAVVSGTVINAVLVVVLTVTAIAVSRPVTPVAVIGIGLSTNRIVETSASLFVLLAMITTYWSVSLALSDIVSERLNIGSRAGWMVATIPTLFLILFGLWGFVEYMQIAGGLVALVVVCVTVPMYLRARREHPLEKNPWFSGLIGSPVVLSIFILGMGLMAVGSLLGL